ncbi:MAG: hypothetical protein IR160_09660 [Salinibacterium sp.]|nr:hypothetical protein [Salinibacterium sp.]MBF0672838.1 hypothetical protein [Salinibacterium sp.]
MPPHSSSRAVGVGRVLIAVYGILALAATARSAVQIIERFDEAPLAYVLSAVSAVVYIAATAALLGRGRTWYMVALVAIIFELVGVLAVGTLSLTMPELFAHPSVWSWFGAGYLFIPLVLPILGLVWLAKRRGDIETSDSVAVGDTVGGR